MLEPLTPLNELERLRTLYRLNLLDSPSDERFDRLTRLAQRLFGVPVALMTLVDKNRQWFKSCQGLSTTETPRSISFCGHAIVEDQALVIPDARRDHRFADNPMVTGEPYIRFYAGQPVKTGDGHAIGTLCLIDRRPRTFTGADRAILRDLAALVEQELKVLAVDQHIGTVVSDTRRVHTLVDRAFQAMAEGLMLIDADETVVMVNPAFTRITGYAPKDIVGQRPGFYLPGPKGHELYTQVRSQLDEAGQWQGEIRARRKSGEVYPVWLSVSTIPDEHRPAAYSLALINDLSTLKHYERQLHFLSHHDALTGLLNHSAFKAALDQALARRAHTGHALGVLSIDLDQFHGVNDTLGHPAGDQVLIMTAQRLETCFADGGRIARASGDKFNILLEIAADPKEATERLAWQILIALTEPFVVDGQALHLSASIGIRICPSDGETAENLLQQADTALHNAQAAGGNTYRHHTLAMNRAALEKLSLSQQLRQALKRNEFQLHYQPRVELASGRITAVEALLRWLQPDRGWVPPTHFIPLAEETGLILPIGEWVIGTACTQIKSWRTEGMPAVRLSINLSARQFRQPELPERLATSLNETGVEPEWLELEITEGMAMDDPQITAQILHQFKAMGVAIALDDFGTGYSSLAYLKRFPVNYLKLDRSFIQDIPQAADNVAITRTVIAMAKNLGLKVTAEGVETEDQRRFLRDEGCDEYQGYLFSPPRAAGEIVRLLQLDPQNP